MPQKVKDIVSTAVVNLGYRGGRNSNWYKDFAEIIHVIGLQKSQWGAQYYLEGGIWLKIFGPDERPKHYECHVTLRLAPESNLDTEDIESALNEEEYYRMDFEERERIVNATLRRAEIEFFNRAKTVDDLREYLGNHHHVNLAVNKVVKEMFHIP